MLYQKPDGTLTIDERDLPEWVWVEWEREAKEREAVNAERYRLMCEQVAAIERDRAIAAEVTERDETIELGEDELLTSFATAAVIAMGECDEIGAELALEFAKFFGACRG